jgi:hypothetical protein
MMLKRGIHNRYALITSLLLAGMMNMPKPVDACTTPVYDYALQHWTPDAWEIRISHGTKPTADEKAAIALLKRTTNANFKITLSTVTGAPSSITVLYPESAGIKSTVQKTRLTLQNTETILASPVRKNMANEIARGRCAVWLFLESGNSTKDDAAALTLKATLQELEKTLVLPKRPEEAASTNDPIAASFAVLHLSRTDPAEEFLVHSLLNSEHDLRDFNEPMAFPVFGRGRMLYALVGKGINPETIEKACLFAAGSCSCEAKLANPGVDLLMTADWNEILDRFERKAYPLLPPTGTAGEQSNSKTVATTVIVTLACVAVLVVAGSVAVLLRSNKSR